MNGKGDKQRVRWSKDFEENYNNIFGEKMLVDYKGRSLEIGKRVRVEVDIPSENGMLYKNSIVKLDEWKEEIGKIRVTDNVGKVWWVEPTPGRCSFL